MAPIAHWAQTLTLIWTVGFCALPYSGTALADGTCDVDPYCQANPCAPRCLHATPLEVICADPSCAKCDPRCICEEYDPCSVDCNAHCSAPDGEDLPCAICNSDCLDYEGCECDPCGAGCEDYNLSAYCDPDTCGSNACSDTCSGFSAYCDPDSCHDNTCGDSCSEHPGHCDATVCASNACGDNCVGQPDYCNPDVCKENGCDLSVCPSSNPCADACGGHCGAHCGTPPENPCDCDPCQCTNCGGNGSAPYGHPWGGVGSGSSGGNGYGAFGWCGYLCSIGAGGPSACESAPGSLACCGPGGENPCHVSCGGCLGANCSASACSCAPGSGACCQEEPCHSSCQSQGNRYLQACCDEEPCQEKCDKLNGNQDADGCATSVPEVKQYGPCGHYCVDENNPPECNPICIGTTTYAPCSTQCLELKGPCPCEQNPCDPGNDSYDPCACHPCHEDCETRDPCECCNLASDGINPDCCDSCEGTDPCDDICQESNYHGDASFYAQVCDPPEPDCEDDPCDPECVGFNPCLCDPTGDACCGPGGHDPCSSPCGGCLNEHCVDDTPCDGPCGGPCTNECEDIGSAGIYDPCACAPGTTSCCSGTHHNSEPCHASCVNFPDKEELCCADEPCASICDNDSDGNICNDPECYDWMYGRWDLCDPQQICGSICNEGCPLASDACICGTPEDCCLQDPGAVCACDPDPNNPVCCGDEADLGQNPCYFGCDEEPLVDPDTGELIYDLCDEDNCRQWLEIQVQLNPNWCQIATCDYIAGWEACQSATVPTESATSSPVGMDSDTGRLAAVAIEQNPDETDVADLAGPSTPLTLSAPYRGPDQPWREACMHMPYGEIANVALSCDVTGPLDVTRTAYFTCEQQSGEGRWESNCDPSVIQFFTEFDAGGLPIQPPPEQPFSDVPMPIYRSDALVRFSAKAIGIRSESAQTFKLVVRTLDNGPVVREFEFTVVPTTLPATSPFMSSHPVLETQAGQASLVITNDTPSSLFGRSYVYMSHTELHARVDDTIADVVTCASVRLPGTNEFINLPHESQFPPEFGFSTPWPGMLDPGWRFYHKIKSDEDGHEIPTRPRVVDPQGNIFLYDKEVIKDGKLWELTEVIPVNAIGSAQHVSYQEFDCSDGTGEHCEQHFKLFRIRDEATDSEIRIYRNCWKPLDLDNTNPLFQPFIESWQNGVLRRAWRIEVDEDGLSAAVIPMDPTQPDPLQRLPLSGTVYYERGEASLRIQNAERTTLFEYVSDATHRLVEEWRNIDGVLTRVAVHNYGDTSTVSQYFPRPSAAWFQEQIITYDPGSHMIQSISVDGHLTDYTWDLDNRLGNVGLLSIQPPGSLPETVFEYAIDGDLPLVNRIIQSGSDGSELLVQDAKWNLEGLDEAPGIEWLFPHVIENYDAEGNVTSIAYQSAFHTGDPDRPVTFVRPVSIHGPVITRGPQPPPASEIQLVYYGPGDGAPVQHLLKDYKIRTDRPGPAYRVTRYDYDAAGRVSRITQDPDGLNLSQQIISRTIEGRVEQIFDEHNFSTIYFYGDSGLLDSVVQYTQPGTIGGTNETTDYYYDSQSRPWYIDQYVENGQTRRTVFTRDLLGRAIRTQVGAASVAPGLLVPDEPIMTHRLHYDHLGNVIRSTQSDGIFTEYRYDKRGLLDTATIGYEALLEEDDRGSYSSKDYTSGHLHDDIVTSYSYDDGGRLEVYVQPDGIALEYRYNPVGLLDRVIRRPLLFASTPSWTQSIQYDVHGQVIANTLTGLDGAGQYVTLSKSLMEYNESGQVYKVVSQASDVPTAEDQKHLYVYFQDGLLKRAMTKGTHPDSGQPNVNESGTPEVGDDYERYFYDPIGRVLVVTHPHWDSDAQTIEEVHDIVRRNDEDHEIEIGFSRSNPDPNAPDGLERTYRTNFDYLDRLLSIASPAGSTYEWIFDSNHWMGARTVTAYDHTANNGIPLSQGRTEHDALGRPTDWLRMVSAANVNPNPGPGSYWKESVQFDLETGRPKRVYQPDGNFSSIELDPAQLQAILRDPVGNVFTRALHSNGQLDSDFQKETYASSTDQDVPSRRLYRTLYSHDDHGHIDLKLQQGTTQGRPFTGGINTLLSNDGFGRTIGITNNDSTDAITLNALGYPIQLTEDLDGLNRVTEQSYDISGAVRELAAADSEAGRQATQYRTDPQGRVIKAILPDASEIHYGYNRYGELSRLTDARGISLTLYHLYDSTGHWVRIVDPFGEQHVFSYDGLGRVVLAETRDTDNQLITSVERIFDSRGLLLQERQTYNGATEEVFYTYNANGAVESVTYPDGTVLSYDSLNALNQPQSVRFGGDLLAELVYVGSRLTRRTLYHEHSAPVLDLKIDHDSHGRPSGYQWTGIRSEGDTYLEVVVDELDWGRDEAGNILYIRSHSGDSWKYEVDKLDRLRSAVRGTLSSGDHPSIEGEPEYRVQWLTGDTLGNWQSIVIDGADRLPITITREHNVVNELVRETQSTNSERDEVTHCYDYDEAGNLRFDGNHYFEYDAWSRLTAIREAGDLSFDGSCDVTGSTPGSWVATYVYDALGRRVSATTDEGQLRFIYGGWRVLEEQRIDGGQARSSRRYFWGTQYIDELWAVDRYDDNGDYDNRYYATHDHNYSVLRWTTFDQSFQTPGVLNPQPRPVAGQRQKRAIDNPTPKIEIGPALPTEGGSIEEETQEVIKPETPKPGSPERPIIGRTQVVAELQYDPFGRLFESGGRDTASNLQNLQIARIAFQGLRYDESGLYHARHRYYDSQTGRWTQRDPRGYIDGMNLYIAFGSNSIRFVDPMGLWTEEEVIDIFIDTHADNAQILEALGVVLQSYRLEQGTQLWSDDYDVDHEAGIIYIADDSGYFCERSNANAAHQLYRVIAESFYGTPGLPVLPESWEGVFQRVGGGGLELVGGVLSVAGGSLLIAAPEPSLTKVGGFGAIVAGSDMVVSGGTQIFRRKGGVSPLIEGAGLYGRWVGGEEGERIARTSMSISRGAFGAAGMFAPTKIANLPLTKVPGHLANSGRTALSRLKSIRKRSGATAPPAMMPEEVFAAERNAEWFDDIARNATRNADSDTLVLGHFAREGTSYQKVAAHYKATYFKVEDWNAVTKGLSQDEIWKINKTFLTQQVKQGKRILFSHDPLKARPYSFFEREVNFLRDLGYRKFEQKNQWTWEAFR